jgi:hypothetical protein
VGRLDAAGLVLPRARERALHVAEQLALEQVLGQGRARDGHERLARAFAPRVQRAREHVLARSALAEQQHRDVGLGGAPRRVERVLHRLGRRLEQRRVAECAAQRAVVAAQPRDLERALHEQAHLVERERLHEVVERALAHRLDRARDRRVGRHQHDHRVGPPPAQLAQQREAVHPRHAHVAEHEVERFRSASRSASRAVLGDHHPVAEPREIRLEMAADVLLVVDDEHARHDAGS